MGFMYLSSQTYFRDTTQKWWMSTFAFCGTMGATMRDFSLMGLDEMGLGTGLYSFARKGGVFSTLWKLR